MSETEKQPWQGPRPYLEVDTGRFFGRGREIQVLLEMIRRNRLLVVTAPSGVGKTSLLLAGVVPKLRAAYNRELNGSSTVPIGPTIVARSWSQSSNTDAHLLLIDSLKSAIDTLRSESIFLADQDAHTQQLLSDKLAEIEEASRQNASRYRDSLSFLGKLCDTSGRLVIILDQFEDALRLSPDPSVLLQIIGRIFETEPRIRMVLSLRHEYAMYLHDLEVQIGGLAQRTYYLRSVPIEKIEEIIQQPASDAGVTITKEAIQTLLRWIGATSMSVSTASSVLDAGPGGEPPSWKTLGSLNLLRLQSLLLDINDAVLRKRSVTVVDEKELQKYARDRDRGRLVNDAIENYIIKTVDATLLAEDNAPPPDASGHLAARLFARLGPTLTSGGTAGTPGYKIQKPLSGILTDVLAPDISALGADPTKITAAILLRLEEDPANVSIAFDQGRSVGSRYSPTSGLARADKLSEHETLRSLVTNLRALLRKLVAGNILKELGNDDSRAYELVHDGLGEAVASWSRGFQQRLYDPLSSLTVVSGQTFRWREKIPANLVISNVFLQGCYIGDAVFEGTTFADCDLRGAVFMKCRFVKTKFVDCTLDGAMFIACDFSTRIGDPACEFKGGLIGSALFEKCQFGSARFIETILDGSVFKDNNILGRLEITKTSLEVAVFCDCAYEEASSTPTTNNLIDIRESDVFCTRIIRTGNPDNTRLRLTKCQLFPTDLDKTFLDEPKRIHSELRK